MRTRTVAWLPSVLLALGVSGLGAEGAILTFTMEGEVRSKSDPFGLGLLDFASIGDPVTYTLTIDSDAPDLSASEVSGEYEGIAGSIRVGETLITADRSFVGVHLHNLFDLTAVFSWEGFPGYALFRLSDLDHSAVTDTALPTTPYDLELFESRSFGLTVWGPVIPPDYNPTPVSFGGSVHAFYIVPEPAGLLLVSPILAILCRRTRRLRGL